MYKSIIFVLTLIILIECTKEEPPILSYHVAYMVFFNAAPKTEFTLAYTTDTGLAVSDVSLSGAKEYYNAVILRKGEVQAQMILSGFSKRELDSCKFRISKEGESLPLSYYWPDSITIVSQAILK